MLTAVLKYPVLAAYSFALVPGLLAIATVTTYIVLAETATGLLNAPDTHPANVPLTEKFTLASSVLLPLNHKDPVAPTVFLLDFQWRRCVM